MYLSNLGILEIKDIDSVLLRLEKWKLKGWDVEILRSEKEMKVEYQSWGSLRLKDIREIEEHRCASLKISKDRIIEDQSYGS